MAGKGAPLHMVVVTLDAHLTAVLEEAADRVARALPHGLAATWLLRKFFAARKLGEDRIDFFNRSLCALNPVDGVAITQIRFETVAIMSYRIVASERVSGGRCRRGADRVRRHSPFW